MGQLTGDDGLMEDILQAFLISEHRFFPSAAFSPIPVLPMKIAVSTCKARRQNARYVNDRPNDIFLFEKLFLIFTRKCYVQIKALFSTFSGGKLRIICVSYRPNAYLHVSERLHHIIREHFTFFGSCSFGGAPLMTYNASCSKSKISRSE